MTRSVGYRTELMLARIDGEVTVRDGYTVVATPRSPHNWCGNFLLLDRAPTIGELDACAATFATEIGGNPGIAHVHLAWDDSSPVDLGSYSPQGFSALEFVVLEMDRAPTLPAANTDVQTRRVSGDEGWATALAAQLLSRSKDIAEETNIAFQRDQFGRYREFAENGRGAWYAAIIEGQTVGGMGLFNGDGADSGLFRGQSVSTVPAARRRGVADALLRYACIDAFDRLGAIKIVLLADPNGPARQVYERVGFRATERLASIVKPAPHPPA